MRNRKPFSVVFRQGAEGIVLNALYLHGRWLVAKSNQQRRTRLRQRRPDIDKKILRRFPFRSRFSRHIQKLYRETVQMTKQALGAYNNPFVLPPRYAFATEQQEPASYSAERHEILLSHEFEYWHCWVRLFVGRICRAINEARIDPRAMPWQMLGQRMREQGNIYQELLQTTIQQGFLSDLLPTWLNFLDLLPPLLEECESTEVISEALLSWFASLEELDQMLERCLRWIIIHEYLHAKTRWIRQRVGKQTFRLLGVVRMQTDIAFQSTLPLQHRLLNEAFTEWMALRFYQQLFQSAIQLRWQDLCWGSPYPAWIIEYVAQALDSQWETLSQAFPALTQHALCCTADLVFHVFFVDPEAVQLLKDLLAHVGHQEDAFEKVSHACDCSHQSGDEAPAQQQAALQDLYNLFAWTFPNEVREKLAFVVSTNVTVEELLSFSLRGEHADLPLSSSHGQEGI